MKQELLRRKNVLFWKLNTSYCLLYKKYRKEKSKTIWISLEMNTTRIVHKFPQWIAELAGSESSNWARTEMKYLTKDFLLELFPLGNIIMN